MTDVTTTARVGRAKKQTDPERHLERPKGGGIGVREIRRLENRRRSPLVDELACECGSLDCCATFPVAAEAYRGVRDRFIVVPAHAGAVVETVIAAADRFFVVELAHSARGSRLRR